MVEVQDALGSTCGPGGALSRHESESEDARLVRELVRPLDPLAQLEPGDDDEKKRAEGPIDACDVGDVYPVVFVGRIGSGVLFVAGSGGRLGCGVDVN